MLLIALTATLLSSNNGADKARAITAAVPPCKQRHLTVQQVAVWQCSTNNSLKRMLNQPGLEDVRRAGKPKYTHVINYRQ